MIIDIFHDTACPWCRIGKKHLFDALEQWQGEAVDIHWHPFLLDNQIPEEGMEFRTFMKAKKGIKPEQLNRLFHYTQQAGEAAGVKLDFDKVSLAVNTTLSHQLIALAPEKSKNTVVEAIYKAYLEDGLNIGDTDVLVSIGEAAGMDATELRHNLSNDDALDEVVTEAALARCRGIMGVPCFRFNNQFNINGSQSVEAFLEALNRTAVPEPL